MKLAGKGAIQEGIARTDGGPTGRTHCGTLRRQSCEEGAGRILREELTPLRWSEIDLAAAPKNSPEKLAIAACLRKGTTLTIKAIAALVYRGIVSQSPRVQ
jgi:hypothetical protein